MKKDIIFFLLYGFAIIQLIVIGIEEMKTGETKKVVKVIEEKDIPVEKFFEKLKGVHGIEIKTVVSADRGNLGSILIEGTPESALAKINELKDFKVIKYEIANKDREIEVKIDIKEE